MTGDDEAIAIIERLCDDPTMWGTHGCPPDYKLERLVAEFRAYGEQCRRAGAEAAQELLNRVMDQCEIDLAAAHAEICKLQGLDPATKTWPEWSSPANTLRWFKELRALPIPSAAEVSSPAAGWKCAARAQGTTGGNEPAECDWPVCGCDPYADKVIAALQEAGRLPDAPSEEARAG